MYLSVFSWDFLQASMYRKFKKVVLGLLAHVTPKFFFSRILRSEALVNNSYFFQNSCSTENYASVNSSCPQSPPGWPPSISIFFFACDGKFPGVGTLELSNSPLGDEKRDRQTRIGLFNAVAIWLVTGQGVENTKLAAVLYSQYISQIKKIQLNQTIICPLSDPEMPYRSQV